MSDYADIPDEPCAFTPAPLATTLDELCRKAGAFFGKQVVLWTPALGARVVFVRDLEGEK